MSSERTATWPQPKRHAREISVVDALGMDAFSPQLIALWTVGALVVGWVLYSLVGQVVAAVRGAKQGHKQAHVGARWGAEDVPTFAQSRPHRPDF